MNKRELQRRKRDLLRAAGWGLAGYRDGECRWAHPETGEVHAEDEAVRMVAEALKATGERFAVWAKGLGAEINAYVRRVGKAMDANPVLEAALEAEARRQREENA